MKFLVFFSCLFATAFSQGRPSYAGVLQKGVPELGGRFKNTSTAPASSTNGVANRVDVGDGSPSTSSELPQVNIADRVNTWPRENQPFWHLNSGHINQHIRPGSGNDRNNQQFGNRQPQAGITNRNEGSFNQRGSTQGNFNVEASNPENFNQGGNGHQGNFNVENSSRKNVNSNGLFTSSYDSSSSSSEESNFNYSNRQNNQNSGNKNNFDYNHVGQVKSSNRKVSYL